MPTVQRGHCLRQENNSAGFAAALSPVLVSRLAAEAVFTASDWRRLGRKRRTIFGITRAMVTQLDALAQGRRP
jgi:hypothetical protein